MRRVRFFAVFAIAVTAALPASGQTQQAAPVQAVALTAAPDLSKQAKPAPPIAPPGTTEVEPEADWIATHAPRSLQQL